jgi:hypothetical protein
MIPSNTSDTSNTNRITYIKKSVSLPEDLFTVICTKYPGVPFSSALTLILRSALSCKQPDIDSDGWYSIAEIRDMMPDAIPIGTKSSKVSRAIASRALATNGETRVRCRVRGDSLRVWLANFG